MQEQVLQKVKQYIAETEMIKQGCTVIAGVSGGPDSMVMLDILRRIQKEYNFFLRVVHVNHGIRGKEALRDQKTVQKICREWKIPCCVYSYDVPCLSAEWKMGTEEAGRKVRRIAFEKEKENVDLINIKCHDLKHQIRNFGNKANISNETVKELENIINIYDSNIKTNNDALDLILTEKSLLCQKKNINLKCFADCSKLNFIAEADLYSLFGNMIDNAIEAVTKIEDVNKRSISLIVRNALSCTSIFISNYYEGKIILDNNGMPKTTKANNGYHGYGLKSIKLIVDKYDGDFKIDIKDSIFMIQILFTEQKQ